MNPGVKPINIFSIVLSIFIVDMIMSLETAFTSYLLKDYYDIHGDRVAEVVGNLGFVGDIGSLAVGIFLGPAMDLFGRKSLSIGGLVIASVSMVAKPLFHHLPWLYFLKLLTNMGTVPLLHSPYAADYVAQESLGLYNTGFILVVTQLSGGLSIGGAIQVQKVLPAAYVYYYTGALALITCIFLLFGLNDVHDAS